ncbi:MAG: T9SS type A sorting domain-containing protein [Aureispira sp.]|nr:T9SS type A sorting domain-containing protein [Aureispira sp.]
MRPYLLIFCSLILFQTSSQAQCGERYKTRYFNSIQVFRDIVYSKDAPALIAATLTTETTFNKDLVMDVFMPPASDTVTKRPAVVIGHGGGFINVAFMGGTALVGTMDNDDVQALADTLAHWGYVTAVIEYRLGFNVASSSSIQRAIWRGSQDFSAAIRFMRKNASWFDVDPTRVFAAGSSAGGFCALHSTFVDDAERIPESFELVPFFKKDLGKMHSRPIVELSSFNPFNGTAVSGSDMDSIPFGIAAYWSAIMDLDWLHQGNNKAPTIMFHGTGDLVVDYKCKRPFSSVVLSAPQTCGTYMMDSTMTTYGMPHEAYYGQGENHEYWGVLNGNWLPAGPNAFWPDIIQKSGNFFHALMKPAAPTVTGPTSVSPSTTYTYSIQNPAPNHSYCWEVTGGSIISNTATSIDVQFSSANTQGEVIAKALDWAEVGSDPTNTTVAINTNVAVEQIPSPILNIRLQPNPVRDQFSILLSSKEDLAAQAAIYNTLGQQVFSKNINIISGKNKIQLTPTELPNGTYFIEISTELTKIVKRFIIL